jgi:serine/threonine protein kinase
MAAVYKAYQPSMERHVAIKVLPRHMSTSEEFVARFRREAKLLAQLQHPYILPVFDYGESDGYPYIVMPFVQSGTLADLIRIKPLSLSETRQIIIQIGKALSYAHAHGMIHRDIKPSNVLINEDGNCLLTDFGLARMVEASTKITASDTVMGTPAYMSPEQGAGSNVDHRSDIYSLGIILYEMVTGRVPYTAETPVAIVFKHIQDPLPSARKLNPAIPESVELVLLKTLAKSPDDRYQSADEFVRAIQKALPESETVDTPIATPPTASTFPVVQSQGSSTSKAAISGSSKRSPSLPWIAAGFGLVGMLAVVAFVGIALLGSRFFQSPAATSTATETTAPTDAPAPIATSTAQPISIPATEEASSDVFQDDFVDQLAEGWAWLKEDPTKWSLSAVPGSLQLMVADASFDGPALPLNILVREPPAGDFEITTAVRFTPTTNFQFAGLVVFQEQGNVLQFGRAYCDVEGYCLGDGIYLDNFENGSINGTSPKVAFGEPVTYLRLQRIGNTYIAYYSVDGENWTRLGEVKRKFSQIQVGILAAQSSTTIPAEFDYFSMRPLQP